MKKKPIMKPINILSRAEIFLESRISRHAGVRRVVPGFMRKKRKGSEFFEYRDSSLAIPGMARVRRSKNSESFFLLRILRAMAS